MQQITSHSFLTVEQELMKRTGIQITGARLDLKSGKIVKFQKLDTSAKIRQRKSKKITPVRRTAP